MSLRDLAKKELEIREIVGQLNGTEEERFALLLSYEVFQEYKSIFTSYATLADQDMEALKRCLFLHWYTLCESASVSGLNGFDQEVVGVVLKTLDDRLSETNVDYELDWMLKYYSKWDFIFEPYPEFKFIHLKIKDSYKINFPETIDHDDMKSRGLMGHYLQSLTQFKNHNMALTRGQ